MSQAYLEPKEVELLEEAALTQRDRLLIRVLYRLGCRVSEGLGITVENIDFRLGTVTITHLKTRINFSCPQCNQHLSRSHSYCPKCGKQIEGAIQAAQQRHRMRVIPIDEDTLRMLEGYLHQYGSVGKENKNLIFGINRHRAWQIVSDCARRAGFSELINCDTGRAHKVSPHRLRDAFAVNAIKHDDTGDGMRLLQQHLGHSSFNTTARYRKISGDEQKAWYRKIWQ